MFGCEKKVPAQGDLGSGLSVLRFRLGVIIV